MPKPIAAVVVLGLMTIASHAADGEERPFNGRLAGNASLVPTGDPCVMRNEATAVGKPTHAGRFAWSTATTTSLAGPVASPPRPDMALFLPGLPFTAMMSGTIDY